MSGAQKGLMATAVGPARPQFPHYSWQAQNPVPRLSYIRHHQAADLALSQLSPGPLGFDLEWRPNYRKFEKENPVALVQLASHDTILLLQVSAMSEFPPKLKELLGDPSRAKAGVSIQRDCLKLFEDYGISTRNCVELALLARSVNNAQWKGRYTNPIGLSRLLETYASFSLAKGRVQRSNWEAHLSFIQQSYAANDALAGYLIYTRLMAMSGCMPNSNTLSPRYYSFSVVNGSLLDHLGVSEWSPQNPYYDPGPPPPPREPKVREPNVKQPDAREPEARDQTLPISPAATANPRSGHSRRGRRHHSAGTNKQFHTAQQATPIMFTTTRPPARGIAEAAGDRALARGPASGGYEAGKGRDGRFGAAGGHESHKNASSPSHSNPTLQI